MRDLFGQQSTGWPAWLLAALCLAACSNSEVPANRIVGACAPRAGPQTVSGSVSSGDAKQYRAIAFEVAPGTGRIEVAYGWTDNPGPPPSPLTATTLDLGLWGPDGYRQPDQFRGWSGSRQGRLDQEQAPVFVEAGAAERGYVPGAIEPGTWYVDLGIAAVSPQGANWTVQVECKVAGGNLPPADPVDPQHVARSQAGWFHGDFHMHGFHSNSNAPDWEGFIEQSRTANLDFLMVTEYVTGRHWQTLGAVQRAHPDLLIWPGREVITYFGHVNTHGETPQSLEYRHGFEDIGIAEIQAGSVAADALFQVNHPTIFPGPVFQNLCRGCEFELGDEIDWGQVDTLEVLTGPVLATGADVGLPIPGQTENPFLQTAIDLWEEQLLAGHRITAVSGSDSKGVDAPEERERKGYGSSATAVFAPQLSRPALKAAIRAGHAYVRTLGANRSPAVEFRVTTDDGQSGIYGDAVQAETATLQTEVVGGQGQTLRYFANGELILTVPVTSDPFVHEQAATRLPNEGPLGTFWRIELHNGEVRTVIGNPVFVQAP